MSQDDLSKKTKKLKNNMPGRSYEVGYGKPPEATRFVKGKSGNPKGRPKGAKNNVPALHEERLKTVIMEEAYRKIKIKEGGKRINIHIIEAVVRSLAVNAVRGDQRSQKILMDLVSRVEADDKAKYDKYAQAMLDYKFGWENEIERRKALGLPMPDLVLHPDEIMVDEQTGLINVTGTFNREEKARKEMIKSKMQKRKQEALEAIKTYRAEMAKKENLDIKHLIQHDIDVETSIYRSISLALKDDIEEEI